MLRAITALILAACTIWSVYWFIGQRSYRDSLLALAQVMRDSGLEVGFSELLVRGYPNRFDATVYDLAISDPVADIGWRAPFFQLLVLSYATDHVIAVWPETQTLDLSGRSHTVRSNGLKASFETSGNDSEIQQIVVESERISMAGLPFAVDSLLFAVRQNAGSEHAYDFSLNASLPEAPENETVELLHAIPRGTGSINAKASLELDRALGAATCAGEAGSVVGLTVTDASLSWPALSISSEAELAFDRDGLASGSISLGISDLGALFALLEQSPLPGDLKNISDSPLMNLPENASFKLSVSDGEVRFLGFPVATLPPFHLCSQTG